MEPKRYIKRPIVIKALQFTGDNREEMFDFTNGVAVFRDNNGHKEIIIPTLEGEMMAPEGAYIVRGIYGEYYPVQESVFNETYLEVKDDN